MTDTLRPCPFCGEGAGLGDAVDGFAMSILKSYAGCNNGNCLSYVFGKTDEEAIAAWNRRPNSERDRLREAVVEAAKEVFKVKRPGYHDCLDDGMPECEWCLLEKALAAFESSQKEG